jgi:hypothetical protein
MKRHEIRKELKLCDENCNHCPIIMHPNNRLVTRILNEAYEKFGSEFYKIVQGYCPNLTCCFDCHIDDFCHDENCKIVKDINE